MTRICEQLGRVPELNGTGQLEVSAVAVPLPDPGAGRSLEEQVQDVAASVNEKLQAFWEENKASPNKHRTHTDNCR
jgi:hypothetical protein